MLEGNLKKSLSEKRSDVCLLEHFQTLASIQFKFEKKKQTNKKKKNRAGSSRIFQVTSGIRWRTSQYTRRDYRSVFGRIRARTSSPLRNVCLFVYLLIYLFNYLFIVDF